jgi:Sec1 family
MAAVSSLPELTERKRVIDKHTNLATALLKAIKERGLDLYYNLEEDSLMGKADLAAVLKVVTVGAWPIHPLPSSELPCWQLHARRCAGQRALRDGGALSVGGRGTRGRRPIGCGWCWSTCSPARACHRRRIWRPLRRRYVSPPPPLHHRNRDPVCGRQAKVPLSHLGVPKGTSCTPFNPVAVTCSPADMQA